MSRILSMATLAKASRLCGSVGSILRRKYLVYSSPGGNAVLSLRVSTTFLTAFFWFPLLSWTSLDNLAVEAILRLTTMIDGLSSKSASLAGLASGVESLRIPLYGSFFQALATNLDRPLAGRATFKSSAEGVAPAMRVTAVVVLVRSAGASSASANSWCSL